jgi:hypothetical protein
MRPKGIPMTSNPSPKIVWINRGLNYQGNDIRRREHMLNLTDMWRATGSPKNQRPIDWLNDEQAKQLVLHLGREGIRKRSMPPNLKVVNNHLLDVPTGELIIKQRGRAGTTWAHWQLALAYARYLSPAFHVWCNDVVRAVMEQPEHARPAGDDTTLSRWLEAKFRALHRRHDIAERNAADIMLIAASTRETLTGERKDFTRASQKIMRGIVQDEEHYDGVCPCCRQTILFDAQGAMQADAQFDHFFDPSMNRPEYGWLICTPCHRDLHASYLFRFSKLPAFRIFQDLVIERRRVSRSGART